MSRGVELIWGVCLAAEAGCEPVGREERKCGLETGYKETRCWKD